jgi:hypothetical protein
MSCRFIDVWPLISSSYDGSGMCPAGPNGEFTEDQLQAGLLTLNQALPAILKRIDAKGTLSRWTVPVWGGIFALPPDCLEVRQVFLNGCELNLRDQWYEGQIGHKISNCERSCGGPDLIDLGDGYSIPEEWPSQHQDTRYGLMAESDEDAGKPVQIRYRDRYGHHTEEVVELVNHQQLAITEGVVSDITFQFKGITKGAVVGFITYPDGRNRRIIRIPANIASPTYRKKKLPRSFNNCSGELSIIGKMRFTPLISVTDTLPICDEMALSWALRALYNLKNGNFTEYDASLKFSINELSRELQDNQPTGVVSQMSITAPFRSPNRKCWY